ncbi:MAG: GspE/PulE family protein [Pirellulales bacterium]
MSPESCLPPWGLLASVDVPSFPGIPWVGFGWTILVCLLAASAVTLARWVRATTDELELDGGDRWASLFAALPVLLVTVGLVAGFWALPLGWAILLAATVGFLRQRDAAVPDSQAFLSSRGPANVAAEIRSRIEASRAGTPAGSSLSLKEQVAELFAKLKKAAGAAPSKKGKAAAKKSKKAAPKAAVAGAPRNDTFTFLRKDGSEIMSLPLDGGEKGAVSANVRNTQKMLLLAIRGGMVDVVVDPGATHWMLRVGKGGALKDAEKLPAEAARGLVSTVKVLGGMGKAADRDTQGTFTVLVGDARYDIQAATTAGAVGEKLVLSIHQAAGGLLHVGLAGLGLRPKALEQVRVLAKKQYGLLLIAGPAGSGRTTTAYAALREIDAKSKKITTIEETIACKLDGVAQIAVETAAGAKYGGVLQMVLKQDPDVILLGDLPDRSTMEAACQAALTGHMVIATMEARDTVGAIADLIDTGMEPMLVQTALAGIVAQRTARRLCPKCRVPIEPPDTLLRKLNLQPGAVKVIYKEKGCPACEGSGFRGQLVLHEVLAINEQIRRLIAAPLPAREIKAAAVLAGMLSLQLDGLAKVVQGETSIDEILRVTA